MTLETHFLLNLQSIMRGVLLKMRKSLLVGGLIALFLCYYASSTLFTHTHEGPSGVVTHSHPYTNLAHTHAAAHLISISHQNLIGFIVPDVVAPLDSLHSIEIENLCKYSESAFKLSAYKSSSLRGPPVA